MYTQCPDCSTAFRVTAEVLRQAAGKVRCGGCGNAFDALSYLSEQMPAQSPEVEAKTVAPQLTAETANDDTAVPRSISAEQSAALLKTLDQLAGSDIRIEDTGVEWRVLDDTDVEGSAELEVDSVSSAAPEEPIDELLEDSPTPVDEFLTETPEVVEAAEVFDVAADEDNTESGVSIDELRFDDNTPLPEEFDLDNDVSPNRRATDDSDHQENLQALDNDDFAQNLDDVDERHHDITLSEPEEWQDILGEFEEIADELRDDSDNGDNSNHDELATSEAELDDTPLSLDEAPSTEDHTDAEVILETSAAVEPEAEAEAEADADADADADSKPLNGQADNEEDVSVSSPEPELTIAEELAALEALETDDDIGEDTELSSANEEQTISANNDTPDATDHFVAPLTEEEQSVNLQIDQDLMALAIEDEDGFSSTIIIPPEQAEESVASDAPAFDNDVLKQTSDGFESIIMEGEQIRSVLDGGASEIEIDAEASEKIAKIVNKEDLPAPAAQQKSRRLVAGIAALSLLIVVQVMHQSRQALATNPTFNSAIGPIYRALGAPLQPKWDVTGWRFEATTDISHNDVVEAPTTDDDTTTQVEDDLPVEPQRLTVYSIVGNKSDTALPYPLIAISLTDRFDATIGNSLLEPQDYLPPEKDTQALVAAGNSFNALINVEPLPESATGFKLDVCYRQGDTELRCALEDFK